VHVLVLTIEYTVMFAQRRNHLTAHCSECIPVIKQRLSVHQREELR